MKWEYHIYIQTLATLFKYVSVEEIIMCCTQSIYIYIVKLIFKLHIGFQSISLDKVIWEGRYNNLNNNCKLSKPGAS